MFRDLITGQHSLCGFLNAGNRVSLLIGVALTCIRPKKSALSSAIALETLESFSQVYNFEIQQRSSQTYMTIKGLRTG